MNPTKPRILQLCAVDFTAWHFLMPLMRAQREWGFDVHLACTPGDYTERIEAEGIVTHPVAIARSRNPLLMARSFASLWRLCRRERFAAVHVHTPVAALAGRPAARLAGVPVVLYTAHGFYFHERMKPQVRAAHIFLEKSAQRFADYLFSQSDEDCQTALATGIAPAGRAMTIGNGIDPERFRPELLSAEERAAVRAEFGIGPADGPVVVMMGRLVREKGYFELVEAWRQVHARFPAARLLIIGDALASDHDDAATQIRAAAEAPEVGGSIIFAGLRGDVPRLLASGDMFVLPSWREGMPRSIIEAMASGLPVIATDIRGCREEVLPEETGLLVPARESGPLAEALIRLIGEPETRVAMGGAGRVRAEEHFSERAVINRQRSVYEMLFREKGITWPRPRT